MINHLKGIEINSIYDFDNTFSINELLCKFWEKIEETINITNESIDILNWIKEEAMTKEVEELITQLVDDGTIERMINVDKIEELKEDLTKILNNVDKITSVKLYSDIDGTDYKKDDIVNVNEIIKKQQINYSKLMRTLKKDENSTNSNINIICRGDSLTYGYDINSNDIRPSVNKADDKGNVQSTSIASITYPEALYQVLRLFNKTITIENLGISGTTVEYSFDRYYKKRDNSIELIMLGTNDSRNTNYINHGNIELFINYYEQLIIRSILWNNAVILIKPPSNYYMRDLNLESYRTAIDGLASKYHLHCIDCSNITNMFDYTHWSDKTHFTGKGYKYIGYTIGNILMNEDFNNPLEIQSNSVILTRPTEDSCDYFNNVSYQMLPSGYTPYSFIGSDGVTKGKGLAKWVGDGKLIYTFKTTEDNLVVMPTVFLKQGTEFKITLDHGLQQPCVGLSTSQYEYTAFDNNRPSEVVITGQGRQCKYDYYNSYNTDDMLIINKSGYHSLTFEVNNYNLLDSGNFSGLYGIEFISFEDWYNNKNHNKYDLLYHSNDTIGTPTPAGTIITLDKPVSDYDYLIVNYICLGLENRIIDTKLSTTHTFRTFNLSENDYQMLFNEISFIVNSNTIEILTNKSIILSDDGTGNNLRFGNASNNSLAEIRSIKGVKM